MKKTRREEEGGGQREEAMRDVEGNTRGEKMSTILENPTAPHVVPVKKSRLKSRLLAFYKSRQLQDGHKMTGSRL